MLYSLGELDRAVDVCARTLDVSDDARTIAAAVAENILGHVSLANGDPDSARSRFISAAGRFKALRRRWGVGNSTGRHCRVSSGCRRPRDRRPLSRRCRRRAVGDRPWFLQIVLYLRALRAIRGNRPDAAIAFIRESLVRIHALHDNFALVYALVPLAAAAELMGDEAWAARILATRDAVTERTGAMAVGRSVRDVQTVERAARTDSVNDAGLGSTSAGRSCSLESLLKEVEDRCSASSGAPVTRS